MVSNHSLPFPQQKKRFWGRLRNWIAEKAKGFLAITSYDLVGASDGVGIQVFSAWPRFCHVVKGLSLKLCSNKKGFGWRVGNARSWSFGNGENGWISLSQKIFWGAKKNRGTLRFFRSVLLREELEEGHEKREWAWRSLCQWVTVIFTMTLLTRSWFIVTVGNRTLIKIWIWCFAFSLLMWCYLPILPLSPFPIHIYWLWPDHFYVYLFFSLSLFFAVI